MSNGPGADFLNEVYLKRPVGRQPPCRPAGGTSNRGSVGDLLTLRTEGLADGACYPLVRRGLPKSDRLAAVQEFVGRLDVLTPT